MQDTLLDLINQTELEPKPTGESYVYAISCPELGLIKVGVSNAPDRRLAELQACFPCDLHHEAVWVGSFAEEQEIHRKLSAYRKRSEWFKMGALDIIRTITTILNRNPCWQPDRVFKKEYREEILATHPAHLQAFLDKWVIFEPDSRVIIGVLYDRYVKWCGGRGSDCLGKRDFTQAIVDKGIEKKEQGGQMRLLGLTLRTSA